MGVQVGQGADRTKEQHPEGSRSQVIYLIQINQLGGCILDRCQPGQTWGHTPGCVNTGQAKEPARELWEPLTGREELGGPSQGAWKTHYWINEKLTGPGSSKLSQANQTWHE